MIRSFLTVSTGTLASRLLGFARDSMIAALLGTGAVADAFLAAFQLVNVVRRLLSEGALNAALIPAWLRVRDRDGVEAASAFAGRVLGTVSAALIAISIVIALLMPLIITIIAPGFLGSDTRDLAVENARLMLPYLAFAGVVQHRPDRRDCGAAALARRRRPRRVDAGSHGRRRGPAATRDAAVPTECAPRDTVARKLRQGDARLLCESGSRHDRQLGSAMADGRRRHHRLGDAVRRLLALFRQPPDRTAARHCRCRHG